MISVLIYCKRHPEFATKVRFLGRDAAYAALDLDEEAGIISADNDVLGFAAALEGAAREIRREYYSLIGKEENNAK